MQLEDLKEIDTQIQVFRNKEYTILNQMIELKNQYISARLSKAELLAKKAATIAKEDGESLALIMQLRSMAEQEEVGLAKKG
ncbi:MAG: hypothetical protein V7K67_02175 [Nostoc sp.]|uniref:hypothetical protein n=1 Tax=Nostoc sp. TaxID=1180 RepID=UPI002FF6C088